MATHTRSHYRPRTSGIQKKKHGHHNIDHEIRWIQRHIKVRKCRRFVRNPNSPPSDIDEDSDPECVCGLCLSKHTTNLTDHEIGYVSHWNSQQDTVSVKNNTFGEIEFTGFGEQCRKYIRVGVDTPMDAMLKLTMDIWGLEKPNLLISVTGGAREFVIKSHIKGLFRRGLMKVARSTGAWIITGGTNLGVMRYVGEAVRDYKLTYGESSPIVAMGIATWGIVQSKESLINEDCRGKWPATYRIENKDIPNESYLDPNHTHFILVDDGTVRQFGKEIQFRALFENTISNMKTNTGKNAVSIPVVLLVLQGGPGTLQTVKQAIYNQIPVVVIEDTGKAADIIAYAYHNSDEIEIDAKDHHGNKEKKTQVTFSPETESEIYNMVKEDFGDKNLDSNIRTVKECVMKKNLVTVLKLGSSASQDVDIAILKALLKANKDQVLDQLKLALAWNRSDIVKNELFNTGDRMWKPGELNEIMFSALLTNKVDFIDIFLDNGVSLREFLTKKRLLLLYNQINPNSLLFSLLKKEKTDLESKSKYISLIDVGNLIHHLIGDFYTPRYLRIESYYNFDVDALLDEGQLEQDTMTTKKTPDFRNPHQEAFLWSVLLNRQNMAKLFWKYSRDSIAAALVASALLHAMSSKTEDKDIRQSLKKNSAEFSSIAMGVLTECYNIDETQAQNLLVRELVNWGNTTCMMIAIESDNKHFISHSACQTLLNKVWNGQLDDDNYNLSLLVSALLPVLIFPLITFTEKKDGTSEAQTKQLKRRKDEFTTSNVTSFEKIPSRRSKDVPDTSERNIVYEGKPTYSIYEKLYYFYTAPVVTFAQNVIAYIVFLALYSYELLTQFKTEISVTEIVLIIWVFSILMEELRQIFLSAHNTRKLTTYFSDMWNIVDVITILLFLCGITLRFMPYSSTVPVARIILGLNLVSFFFRLLHIFSVHKHLGPKLVMIWNMMIDLIYFMVILLVIVISYSIAAYSILYPYSSWSQNLVLRVLRLGYWNLYGELLLDEIEDPDEDCSYDPVEYNHNTTQCPTTIGRKVVPVLMGIYVLFCNILLLNLLIAMFSNTFQKIQNNTDLHWHFYRYFLIAEYYTKPYLAPPFILLSHLYMLFIWLLRRCGVNIKKPESEFSKKFPNERELIQWEDVVANCYIENTEQKELESVANKIKDSNNRMDTIMERMDELQEQVTGGGATPVNQTLVPPTHDAQSMKIMNRVKHLESKMSSICEMVEFITNEMKKRKSQKLQVNKDTEIKDKTEMDIDKQLEQNRQLVQMLIDRRLQLQVKSRQSPYPGSQVARFPVPDEFVFWEVDFPQYFPTVYESPEVKDKPFWADPDNLLSIPIEQRSNTIKFNTYDTTYKVSRVSYMGPYNVVQGLPINPHGRTGIIGRGLLGRWGPNHAADPVITRWKRDKNGQIIKDHGKPVFEFVAILRRDNQKWAIPGGFCDPNEKVISALKTEFSEEALGHKSTEGEHKSKLREKLDVMFEEGVEIYRGYADDPRNTDNAWIETLVYHYHDNDDTIFSGFELKAGSSVDVVSWVSASSQIPLHGTHTYYIKLVAERLNASF